MASLTTQAVWDEIYSIAEDDPVQGGDGGIDNIPHQQLANRTAFLKAEIEKTQGNLPDGEDVSLATVLQRLKDLEGKPDPTLPEMPTIKQFMIPVGGLFETVKPYATGSELTTDMGYGTWERYGEGRMTLGLTTAPEIDSAGNAGVFSQIGEKFGEYDHLSTIEEMPPHAHAVDFVVGNISGSGHPATDNSSGSAANLKTDAVGGNQPHNNMPPVIVVGRWVRTA